MSKCLVPVLLLLAVVPSALCRKPRPTVTFVSPVECHGDHGKWRWKVKTQIDRPPADILADHRVTPSDIGGWDPPEEKITTRTPRVGRETEWSCRAGRSLPPAPQGDPGRGDRLDRQATPPRQAEGGDRTSEGAWAPNHPKPQAAPGEPRSPAPP
jgi:hypothetical protein